MYQYQVSVDTGAVLAGERVSLHDCRAERASLEGQTLIFDFPEGFWVREDGGGKGGYTGASRLVLPLLYGADDAVTVYVYTETGGGAMREELPVQMLLDRLNSGQYSLEFLYPYYGWQSLRFDCWLWFDQSPYHKECELIVLAKEAVYQWNAAGTV